MTFNEFKNEIVDCLTREFADKARVEVKDVKKNNNVVYSGLIIKEEDVNITPTIYLEHYYKLYMDGQDFDSVYERLVDTYNNAKLSEDFDMDFLYDYEAARGCLNFKLINRESNSELLKNIPYVEYLDLAIVFFYLLKDYKLMGGYNTLMITNDIMKMWGCSVDDLMINAMENTPKSMGIDVKNIEEFIAALIDKDAENLEPEPGSFVPFYVASNRLKMYGAGVMIYKDFLKEMAETFGKSLYIIPSSVHEIIIIPAEDYLVDTAQNLRDTISYVNSEEVNPTEVLSNNLYFYSYEENTLSII